MNECLCDLALGRRSAARCCVHEKKAEGISRYCSPGLSWFELLTFRQIIPPDRAVTIGQLQVLFTRGTLLAPADDTERHGSTVGILAWGRNS